MRIFISALLAAALATTSVAPVQAQTLNREAQRTAAAIAFGLATLAIIAKAADAAKKDDDDDDDDDDRDRQRFVTRDERPLPRVIPRDEARPHVRRGLTVPSSCARRVEAGNRIATAFGAPCLRRAGVDINRLPRRCERRADVGRRDVRIWGARCLTRNGIRID